MYGSSSQLQLVVAIYTVVYATHSQKVLTVLMATEAANEAVLDAVYHTLTHEFGVRLKQRPLFKDKCLAYSQLSKKYAPLPGQTMLLFIPKNESYFTCKKKEGGNMIVIQLRNYTDSTGIQHFNYGEVGNYSGIHQSGTLYSLIDYLHTVTTVSSDPYVAYYESSVHEVEKPKSGLLVPGYLALIVSLGTVVALAIAVKLWVHHRKRRATKSTAILEKALERKAEDSRVGDSRKKKAVMKGNNNQGSESWSEFHKSMSKETCEELAPIISKGRSLEEVLDNPVVAPEFLFYLHRLARLAIEYFDDPSAFSVTTELTPGFLYRTMPRFAPGNPENFEDIYEDLKKKILPGMTHWQHPRFYAYFPAGRRYPDVLAELLTSAMAFNVFSWESCPSLSELENLVVNWIGRAFGLPEAFLFQESLEKSTGGGSIVGSASDAIFCSVMVSRNWKINQVKMIQRRMGKPQYETTHDIGKKLVVYCSKDAHSGIEKACKVAMVRCRPLQPLAENGWGITGEQLEKCILQDLDKGLIPTHIHCTLGTSATAADDHLESIWPIAEKYEMWIHCDASYSGNSWIDEKYRGNANSLAHVHSLNVNLHKFLLFSGMTCLVWTRERKIYKDAFTTASFQNFPLQDKTDMRDWGVHVSRRNKALKIWMSVRLNGLEGLRYHLNNTVEMCSYFESMVAKHPLLKIFSRKLALFTFYYEEPGSSKEENNKYTEDLCQFINQSHMLFLAPTKVHDINLIRVSISYERINKSVIAESWNILKSLVEEFTNRKNDPYLLQTKMVAPPPRYARPIRPSNVDYAAISANTPSSNTQASNNFNELPASKL